MKSLYQALLDEQAKLATEADGIIQAAGVRADTDAPGLTEDERKRLDAIEARQEVVSADLGRENRRRERERALPLAADVRVEVGRNLAEDDPNPWGKPNEAPFGRFLQAVYSAQTGQGIDPRLTYIAAAQGAGAAIGPDGGFLVGKTMADSIKLRMTAGEIFRRLDPIPLDAGTDSIEINMIDESSRATGSRFGAVQGYWIDEGTAPTASRPKFYKYSLKLKGLAALGYATNNLLRNAAALETVMLNAFAQELLFLVEDSVINGGGAGQPLGILNAGCLVSVSKETGQAAATIVYENLSKMWARMLIPSRSNAVWLMNADIEPQLDSLALTAGLGALEPRFVAYDQQGVLRIKGRPVIPIEYAATLGTVGDLILADFREYGFIEEQIAQASSMHVAFTTNEMCYRVTYYVDGGAKMRTALTPYKGTSNTQSPFVALATRA